MAGKGLVNLIHGTHSVFISFNLWSSAGLVISWTHPSSEQTSEFSTTSETSGFSSRFGLHPEVRPKMWTGV